MKTTGGSISEWLRPHSSTMDTLDDHLSRHTVMFTEVKTDFRFLSPEKYWNLNYTESKRQIWIFQCTTEQLSVKESQGLLKTDSSSHKTDMSDTQILASPGWGIT